MFTDLLVVLVEIQLLPTVTFCADGKSPGQGGSDADTVESGDKRKTHGAPLGLYLVGAVVIAVTMLRLARRG
jgi:hypothetical protein